MAINPLISLQVPGVDVGAAFSNALLNLGRLEDIKQARAQAPARQRTVEAQAQTAQSQAAKTANTNKIRSLAIGAQEILPALKSGDISGAMITLQKRSANLAEAGVDNSDTLEAINTLKTNPALLMQRAEQAVQLGTKLGVFGAAKTGLASAKTEILESGATIQSLPDGRVIVKNPLGNIVEGAARTDVLREAREAEVRKQQERADITVSTAERVEQVKKSTQTADKAFGMVDNIRQNIENLKKVIPLVGQGASTGPITSLFPSFKAATIKLENQQKRLGLDVVGAVTFGALSKGELDLAMATALPLTLDGDELIQWVNDKISAQSKLGDYYEEQAIFLSTGTQAEWLEHKKNELKGVLDSAGASESDIRQTMKDNNMTRPQVIDELKRRSQSGGA